VKLISPHRQKEANFLALAAVIADFAAPLACPFCFFPSSRGGQGRRRRRRRRPRVELADPPRGQVERRSRARQSSSIRHACTPERWPPTEEEKGNPAALARNYDVFRGRRRRRGGGERGLAGRRLRRPRLQGRMNFSPPLLSRREEDSPRLIDDGAVLHPPRGEKKAFDELPGRPLGHPGRVTRAEGAEELCIGAKRSAHL